ncbi:protein kinase [Pendulispora albinea]|uniref:Protein kinase n=2 Tax=Pendulispora albinea TaxID=2741071 RepID=A0ABZ2MCN3_9BACT
MGEVFLAVSHGPGGFSKLSVIKRLRHDIAADEGFIEMFLNEARLAGRLSHPNIVQTKEVGVDGDAHFMVMEYLEGQTLFYILRKLRLGESAGGPALATPDFQLGSISRNSSDAQRSGGSLGTSDVHRTASLISSVSASSAHRREREGERSPEPPSRKSWPPESGRVHGSGPKSISQVRKGTRSYHMPHATPMGFTLAIHLQIISDVLAGLHYAHEVQDFEGRPLHLIHRDVAPSNIFVTYDGQVKVLDFGIAKASDSGNATRAGVFKGKVAYMAPEQFVNANIDRRCDVFAAGATLWEAAAGTRLWRGLSDVEIFRHLAEGHIPPPSTVAPNVDPRLEAICMRALAFDRELRYPTAQALRADLDALIDELGRPSREEVGQVIARMFAAERAHARTLIEAKLRALREQELAPARTTGTEGYVAVADPTVLAPMDSLVPPPNRKKHVAAAAAALAVVGTLGTAAWWTSRPPAPVQTSTPSAASGAASSAPVLTSNDAPAPTAPSPLPLRISASPSTAVLYVDDVRVATNPYVATVVPDASSHRIRVEAPGYRAQTDFVQFAGTAPIALHVDLVAEKSKPVFAPGPRKPPKVEPPALANPGAQSPKPPESATVNPAPAAPSSKPPRPKPFEIDVNDPYKK